MAIFFIPSLPKYLGLTRGSGSDDIEEAEEVINGLLEKFDKQNIPMLQTSFNIIESRIIESVQQPWKCNNEFLTAIQNPNCVKDMYRKYIIH